MPRNSIREQHLYAPVKSLLESQGYEVKGEVGALDIVAMRHDEDPLVVELKTGFSLSLIHQAIDRQRITDIVYIAVPRGTGRAWHTALKRNIQLCRRLGLGLLTVRLADGVVDTHLDPAPYTPRKAPRRKARLLKEFTRRVGDPNPGGSTRRRLMTAYRQDALRCLALLDRAGPTKAAFVARHTGVPNARRLVANNHYGWFKRVATGIYAVSANGERALGEYASELARLRLGCTNADGGESSVVLALSQEQFS